MQAGVQPIGRTCRVARPCISSFFVRIEPRTFRAAAKSLVNITCTCIACLGRSVPFTVATDKFISKHVPAEVQSYYLRQGSLFWGGASTTRFTFKKKCTIDTVWSPPQNCQDAYARSFAPLFCFIIGAFAKFLWTVRGTRDCWHQRLRAHRSPGAARIPQEPDGERCFHQRPLHRHQVHGVHVQVRRHTFHCRIPNQVHEGMPESVKI